MGVAVKYCSCASARRMGSTSPRDENCIDFPNCDQWMARNRCAPKEPRLAAEEGWSMRYNWALEFDQKRAERPDFVKEARRAVVVVNISDKRTMSIRRLYSYVLTEGGFRISSEYQVDVGSGECCIYPLSPGVLAGMPGEGWGEGARGVESLSSTGF